MSSASLEIVAHRGYSARAPENTLAALRAALDAGASSLEWDVRMARDGIPVLFHDDVLDRTTDGRGRVDRCTSEELARLDAGGWFSEEFRGEPVPTLEQALTDVAGRAAAIYPEIKAYHDTDELTSTAALVARHGLVERTVFISMDWGALEVLKGVDPTLRVGYIVEKPQRFGAALERAKDDPTAIVDLDYRIVLANPAVARKAEAHGVELVVWTVDAPEEAERLADQGVTRLTTNQVALMLDWSRTRVH